ncbi:nucleolar protein 14 [Mycena floridula]|nr:nucleolar protein 14 [Mycena floridula]
MAKGSQLSQLKTALNKAGISGQPQNGKKRKRTVPQESDKEKKAAKLAEIHRKLNPFDVKVTKLKHDVGGRKTKGVKGRPAESKMAGIEQRKKTLLKEYEERDHAGGILDRRFGENDPTMSIEERMLERFTKERQRASKSSAFNLEDEDELTHYGQSLSKLDDFDNVGLTLDDDDDEETGRIDDEIVKNVHFSGFDDDEEDDEDGQPARKKSKAEVMAEVIAKSKEHRMLRQMEKEQGENVRHELDQVYDSIRDLLHAPLVDPSSSGSNAVPLGTRPEPTADVAPVVLEAEDVNYDQHVRELAFDKRAKPKDRTKTEEELAVEAKEALEKAERRRRKRMLGLEDSDSEGEGGNPRKRRKRGGDDLDDDFDDGEASEWAGIGPELAEAQMQVEEEDEDEEEEEDKSGGGEGDHDEDDSEEDDDGEEGDSEEDSESEKEEGDHEELVSSTKSRKATGKSKELPFTFPCPSTHQELLDILANVEDEDVPTVVQRIRTLHHSSLSADNKFKLQTLSGVLIEHILYLASPPTPRFAVLNSTLPHLIALTRAYPIESAQHFVGKLTLMHKNLKRGLFHGPLEVSSRTWPGFAELTFLRIIGIIWPTSDMNHAVVSPTRVLMGAYLGLGRIRSLSDMTSGLFLCTLFLQYEQLSKRFVPEAINLLVNAVLHLAPNRFKDVSSLPGSFPAPDFRSDLCRPLALNPKKALHDVEKPDLWAIISSAQATEENKASLLDLALDLLGRYADLYKGLEGFIELYSPVTLVLAGVQSEKLTDKLQRRHGSLSETLGRLLKFSHQARQPLRLQTHKPIPIPSYIPKFELNSSLYMRRQDPDHERNETAKLKSQYKQERKGAIRELRKDARFLADVQQKQQKEKDRVYNDRMKKVFGSIESERAEEKAMDREKVREKKRAGRK